MIINIKRQTDKQTGSKIERDKRNKRKLQRKIELVKKEVRCEKDKERIGELNLSSKARYLLC